MARSTAVKAQGLIKGTRTFPMDPQQRTRRFPIGKGIALCTPGCSVHVVSLAGSVIIDRWVWGRDPFSKVLA
jgi:hypothetical protein